MIFTGIADEASLDLGEQIRTHRALGWDTLELRLIGKTNVCDLDDADFEQVARTIAEEGMKVICFASSIANWSRPITSDFSRDLQELQRAAPRMRRLAVRLIRVMSYPNDGLEEREWRREAIRRSRELAAVAEGEGVVLVHENCSGWGATSPRNMRALIEEVDSPAYRVVFDTGNPAAEGHSAEEAWQFYREVRPYIEHIHIKDTRRDEKGAMIYTFPGEGANRIEDVLRDALATGYDGALSIEPHITSQIHLGTTAAEGQDAAGIYREYAHRAMDLVQRLRAGR
jgi:sugar phosphate isomerase/epimerase